ncbi:MAG: hypothetical protein A4E61_00082 [Syntrophorhabdus sp. PtaB.Bin184]|nr:MAG: hypothetical protein A4E61_00082 [Syntrophorhabdus sp. PtaB.Bin184]
MFPTFQFDLKGRLTAAGIVALLLSVSTLMMPYMQASVRNNRVFLLGVACLAVMAILMLRHTLTGFLLLGYVTWSLLMSANESVGSAMYQILCLSGVFLVASWSYDRWKDYKGWVYNAICIVALANVAAQLVQVCGVSFPRGLKPYEQYGFVGLLGNVNETSALLAVCLPFFFRKRWPWAIPAIVAGLVLARTTNGIIAASIVSLIWMTAHYRRWAVVILCYCAIIALVGAFSLTVDRLDIAKQLSGRGLVYKVTALASTVKPFGWGFGQFDYVIPLLTHTGVLKEKGGKDGSTFIAYLFNNVADADALDKATVRLTGREDVQGIKDYLTDPKNNTTSMFIQAHNDYLEAAFALGIPGLVLLLAFLWRSLVRGFRKKDNLPAYALVASALTACLFFAWQIIPIALITVMCLVFVWGRDNG